MKTEKIVLKNSMLTMLALVLICTLQSCVVEIPETDIEAPTFSFKITGDGFDHTFTQDSDFNVIQLNLRENTEYDFLLSGSDRGGVKQIQMQFTPDYIELIDPVPTTWSISEISALSSVLAWSGDPANPISGNILAGSFRTDGNLVSHELKFTVKDYGGTSGSVNTFFASLNIYSGVHATEIVLLR